MTRRVVIDGLGYPGQDLFQVRYWDPSVRVWCDFGDPVPAAQINDKAARCRAGGTP